MDFDAIIFDCDGVLVDSEAIYVVVERSVLAEFGMTYDHADYLSRFVGLSESAWLATIAADLRRAGLDISLDEFSDRVTEIVWPRIESELTALPGVRQLADRFDDMTAVASSSPMHKLIRKLEITGLRAAFEPRVFSGEQVARGKPAPDLFVFVAEQLETTPERCLIVEDSVAGVTAGAAAGSTVFGYTGGGHADDGLAERLRNAGAHAVFENHADIERFLFR